MNTSLIIIIAVALALLGVFLLLWRRVSKYSENRETLKRNILEECEVTAVVVKGRQDHLLLVDDKNNRLLRFPLLPGMTVTAIGVAKKLPDGSLAVNARDIDEYNEDDFELDDVRHSLH